MARSQDWKGTRAHDDRRRRDRRFQPAAFCCGKVSWNRRGLSRKVGGGGSMARQTLVEIRHAPPPWRAGMRWQRPQQTRWDEGRPGDALLPVAAMQRHFDPRERRLRIGAGVADLLPPGAGGLLLWLMYLRFLAMAQTGRRCRGCGAGGIHRSWQCGRGRCVGQCRGRIGAGGSGCRTTNACAACRQHGGKCGGEADAGTAGHSDAAEAGRTPRSSRA